MTKLNMSNVVWLARNAGFTSDSQVRTIVAIAWAESNWDTTAYSGPNFDGSYDRGILQINTIHNDISRADCNDPVKAFAYGYRLSRNGTYFGDWSTFNDNSPRSDYRLMYGQVDTSKAVKPGSVKGLNTPSNKTNQSTQFSVSDPGSGVSNSGYAYLLAYTVFIIIFLAIIKTRVGYRAMYYLLCLALLFLIVSQAGFVADSLAPITGQFTAFAKKRGQIKAQILA